jgi:CHAT domain-containing protein
MTDGRPAVLAEYAVTGSEVHLFLMRTGDAFPVVESHSLAAEPLVEVASAFLGWILSGGRQARPDLPALEALVAPIARYARPGDAIWIVPQNVLSALPLHALEVDGRTLIEDHVVCYSPSASWMKLARARGARGVTAGGVVVGDTRSDLPFARAEAETVARLLGTKPILGPGATKSVILKELRATAGNAGIIHFACHSFFDKNDAMASGICVSSAPDADDTLRAGEIHGLELGANLVTLSTCDSGRQSYLAGDEFFGLPRAFLSAGVPAMIASQWEVNDLSGRLFFETFYPLILDGVPKADALRMAALSVRDATLPAEQGVAIPGPLAGSDGSVSLAEGPFPATEHAPEDQRSFRHPYYWAPFLLVGDWR